MLSPLDIARRRFASQYLAEPTLRSPADVVGWLGAVQAQDYLAAKWGVAQRTAEPKDAAVEKALNAGTILRTHVLRPTWHFVRERDIRWMLALTAPRVIAASAYYLRKLELDDAVVRRSRTALTKALQGGKHLTRADVGATLRRARIEIGGPGMARSLGCPSSSRDAVADFGSEHEIARIVAQPELDLDLGDTGRRAARDQGQPTPRPIWPGVDRRQFRVISPACTPPRAPPRRRRCSGTAWPGGR